MSHTAVIVALAGFQLLIEARNGRKPEFNLICHFFIRGMKWPVNVKATKGAIVSSEIGHNNRNRITVLRIFILINQGRVKEYESI